MRAVLYLRMSKDIQESSPKDQRKALTEHAEKHGHTIVGEYFDEGISGDSTEKRIAFQKMISDCRLKTFELVLCWDQDRFGRFDPLEAGFWIKPMRDAGVVLETIAQGRIDWEDFAGRIVWSVQQEAKHAFLRDLARNSLRGNIARAKKGLFTGRAPFGYVCENDRLELDDEDKVAAVRRAFELRLQRLGYRMIGLRLTEEGHPSPSGKTWSPDAVRLVLNREMYTGILIYGSQHRGKYSTLIDGTVGKAVGGVNPKNRSPIRIEGAHDAIIDVQTWRAVNDMHREPPKPHANRGNSGAPLAGLLRCGECGSVMYSQSLQRKAGQKTPNYICGSYMLGKGCGYRFIGQARIHDIVAETIREKLLGGSKELLIERIQKQLDERKALRQDAAEKRKLTSLEKKIAIGTERLSNIDQRLFAGLERQLLAMMDERDSIKKSLSLETPKAGMSAEEIANQFWELGNVFDKSDAGLVRAKLRLFIDHIRLDFSLGKKTGRGQSYVFCGGEMILSESSNPCVSLAKATMFCTSTIILVL